MLGTSEQSEPCSSISTPSPSPLAASPPFANGDKLAPPGRSLFFLGWLHLSPFFRSQESLCLWLPGLTPTATCHGLSQLPVPDLLARPCDWCQHHNRLSFHLLPSPTSFTCRHAFSALRSLDLCPHFCFPGTASSMLPLCLALHT